MGRRNREEEEDDEDYQQPEDEDEEYPPPVAHSKKKRRTGAFKTSFIDTEAQEDEDGDEDDYEGDGDAEGLIDDDFRSEAQEARELELAQRRELDERMGETGKRKGGTNHLQSAIGKLEERYADLDFGAGEAEDFDQVPDGEDVGVGEEEYFDPMQDDVSRLLPATSGWKLWKVPTIRPGVEREACIAVLKKFAEAPDSVKESFQIGAAYASESVKGAIYIEALSPLHILDALRDVRILLLSKQHIKMVPVREMADVFNLGNASPTFPKRGEWVRFARGLYAGDLALVSDLDESSHNVVVRVVPRIDLSYEYKAIQAEAEDGIKLPAPKHRPAAGLISLTDLEARNIEPERVNDIVEGFRFHRHLIEESTGYLVKTTKLSQLITGDKVKATSTEIEDFANGRDLNEIITDIGIVGKGGADGRFEVGQRVWISKGDLSGISGTVVATEGDKLRIQPDNQGLTAIDVEPGFCVKRFDLGESVKVIAGRHEGDVGLIVKLEIAKGLAHVLSTETHRQISVNLGQLASTPNDTLTPVGLTKIDGYSIGDLVQLSTTLEVGVITKILKTRRIEVLTKDGITLCDIAQLSGKKTMRLAHALDSQNQQFGIGASVEIIEGPFTKKVGSVKYIWKETIFVQVPSAVTSGGIVAVESSAVRVQQASQHDAGGGTVGGDGSAEGAGHGPPGAGRGRGRGDRGFTSRGQPGFYARFQLMGKQVKIVGGPQKGLLGELRNVQGPEALVLVGALGKEMRFPRASIQLVDDTDPSANRWFR
eukprot:Gregarina_sp_Poly_1__765@NODE_1183_length_4845_cov_142_002721_g813_i0_p1_GENE_NODE_1183_length_4845_cov_142_002721_g813_i0NODE_1183_length_4845_cov_142_002721_g813_i0_p1_ORF_typecomplete_len767_score159_74Spt5NGN/PF03439_13/5_8e13KOW/PF00467_29/8_2e02KOW/PF00467_29/0_00065KOW/PF00467_29/2_2e03KOW/PF00467_29/50KOW/PF00467_29/1_5PPV_E1_N/PF00524_18/0_00093Spt5_N/PF11942_8/8_8e02Spt5_N/PF11942_8/0_012AbiEi_4/PF13338_6/0_62AbiEi_4/PF13338_6/6e03_NODE_1183_length_4845_cov_142_002721_g813_i09123212